MIGIVDYDLGNIRPITTCRAVGPRAVLFKQAVKRLIGYGQDQPESLRGYLGTDPPRPCLRDVHWRVTVSAGERRVLASGWSKHHGRRG